MSNLIGPTVKNVSNVALPVLHNIWVCHKHNNLLHGPILPSYPFTKEIHVRPIRARPASRNEMKMTSEIVTIGVKLPEL